MYMGKNNNFGILILFPGDVLILWFVFKTEVFCDASEANKNNHTTVKELLSYFLRGLKPAKNYFAQY